MLVMQILISLLLVRIFLQGQKTVQCTVYIRDTSSADVFLQGSSILHFGVSEHDLNCFVFTVRVHQR